jgi:hypothetical protein
VALPERIACKAVGSYRPGATMPTMPTALHTRPPCAPDGPTGCLKRSEQLPLVLTQPGRV